MLLACPADPIGTIATIIALASFASAAVAFVGAGPAAVAAYWTVRARAFAPLVRGTLERSCTVGAALVAAVSAVAWVLLLLRVVGSRALPAAVALIALGHPVLAVAPWFAGETLSGPSQRRVLSLGAAIVVAGALSWAMAIPALQAFEYESLTAAAKVMIASGAALVGLSAAGTYLALRGEPCCS
jgi:hypothetical protein